MLKCNWWEWVSLKLIINVLLFIKCLFYNNFSFIFVFISYSSTCLLFVIPLIYSSFCEWRNLHFLSLWFIVLTMLAHIIKLETNFVKYSLVISCNWLLQGLWCFFILSITQSSDILCTFQIQVNFYHFGINVLVSKFNLHCNGNYWRNYW